MKMHFFSVKFSVRKGLTEYKYIYSFELSLSQKNALITFIIVERNSICDPLLFSGIFCTFETSWQKNGGYVSNFHLVKMIYEVITCKKGLKVMKADQIADSYDVRWA